MCTKHCNLGPLQGTQATTESLTFSPFSQVFNRYRLRPRAMVDVTNIEASLKTTILGYEFENPFFISPAAKAQYGHPDAELNLMKGAGAGGIPYIVSLTYPPLCPSKRSTCAFVKARPG